MPVTEVVVDEGEAELLLATLDPLSSLARPDPHALETLLERVRTESEPLREMLEELSRQPKK